MRCAWIRRGEFVYCRTVASSVPTKGYAFCDRSAGRMAALIRCKRLLASVQLARRAEAHRLARIEQQGDSAADETRKDFAAVRQYSAYPGASA